MFSVNGVALDNPALGWELLAPSVPLSALQQRATRSERAGRDGVTVAPSTRGPVSFKFTVRTPKANLSTLLSLFSAPALTIREISDPARSAAGILASSAVEMHYPRVDLYSHSFLLEIPEGCWRGDLETTALVHAAPAGVTGSLFPGMSAPVQDALVRLAGPLENPQILDSSGAFLALEGTLESGKYLRFDSDTGRAWITAADTWVGGDEVSGLIDFGGPRGTFEITPAFTTPGDPTAREGRLTLNYDSYNAGAGFQVRGRAAYLL